MPVTVTLAGPAPWGFRITGGRDFGKPITVSKVMERGKAAAGDLRLGDVIVSINGESAAEMLNVEAQNKIKQSPGQLQLQVERLPMPSPSHANGDGSPEGLAARFQVRAEQPLRALIPLQGCFQLLASPLPSPGHPPLSPLQEPASLTRHNGSSGCVLPPSPHPPSPPAPWETSTEQHPSPPSPGPCSRYPAVLGPPGGAGGSPQPCCGCDLSEGALQRVKAPVMQVWGVGGFGQAGAGAGSGRSAADPPTQAVRIQEGRYRHPSCYACSDCGLNLKMRGHFWVGDEMYCEKHARLRYQGARGGGNTTPPTSAPS
ncbi:PDLI2 protein, partial [Alectura lathami]|nr:PDLI2 protein [Alectura lathami]